MKITLRELLLLVLAIGLALGWWLDQWQKASERDFFKRAAAEFGLALIDRGATVELDYKTRTARGWWKATRKFGFSEYRK